MKLRESPVPERRTMNPTPTMPEYLERLTRNGGRVYTVNLNNNEWETAQEALEKGLAVQDGKDYVITNAGTEYLSRL